MAEMFCNFSDKGGWGGVGVLRKRLSYPDSGSQNDKKNINLQLYTAQSEDDYFDNLLKKVGLLRSWLRQLRQPPLLPAPSFEIKRKLNQKC